MCKQRGLQMIQHNGPNSIHPWILLSWEWYLRQSLWPFDLLVLQAKVMVMSPFLPQVPWRVVETNLLLTQHAFQINIQTIGQMWIPTEFVAKTLFTKDFMDVTLAHEMTNFNNSEKQADNGGNSISIEGEIQILKWLVILAEAFHILRPSGHQRDDNLGVSSNIPPLSMQEEEKISCEILMFTSCCSRYPNLLFQIFCQTWWHTTNQSANSHSYRQWLPDSRYMDLSDLNSRADIVICSVFNPISLIRRSDTNRTEKDVDSTTPFIK